MGIAAHLNGLGNYKYGTGTTADRNGGDGYAEVLIFTNRLTLAEHARVERYLCAKYDKTVSATQSYTFDLAPGAEIALDGVSPEAVTITGGATVIRPADGDVTIGHVTDAKLNTLGTGTTTLKCDAALPATAGTVLTAAEGLKGTDVTEAQSVPGNADIEKTGLQKVTLRTLPAGTGRLTARQGVLALTASFATTNREVYATITNANFDTLLSGSTYVAAPSKLPACGWTEHSWALGSFTDSYSRFVRQRDWSVT